MKYELIKNNHKDLIVFLTGWGCDNRQFSFMKSEKDILIVYDYTSPDFNFDFDGYENYYLITFSAGVFMAGFLKDKLPNLKKAIAINGNPLAYDEYFGLRPDVVDMFKGITLTNAMDFRRGYLVYDDEELKLFNRHQAYRDIESCLAELHSLVIYDKTNPAPFNYDIAILSENDKIFTYQHQLEYWEPKAKCITLKNCAHFPFFRLNDFDKILKLT